MMVRRVAFWAMKVRWHGDVRHATSPISLLGPPTDFIQFVADIPVVGTLKSVRIFVLDQQLTIRQRLSRLFSLN